MDKNEALKRLGALETEAQALRKIIEAPEVAPSLLGKPVPMSWEKYWCVTVESRGERRSFQTVERVASVCKQYTGGNMFTDEATANAYAEAIDTMLLLRHQPGTVAATGGVKQFVIEPGIGGTKPLIDDWSHIDSKVARLSPCFSTLEHARAALDAVGADRIERMWKTLHHIED